METRNEKTWVHRENNKIHLGDTMDTINIGSGRFFYEDCINIDIQKYCNPDVVLDITKPLFDDNNAIRTFFTDRLGEVKLQKNSFSTIVAFDVLEHLEDLLPAMKNVLDLLRVNGTFHIKVPYDLSYGAWQDPTHVRAFNERSWLYYTDWAYYIGWNEYRFVIDSLDFKCSEYGEHIMKTQSKKQYPLLIPRAIDSMEVKLRKIKVSEQEVDMGKRILARVPLKYHQ